MNFSCLPLTKVKLMIKSTLYHGIRVVSSVPYWFTYNLLSNDQMFSNTLSLMIIKFKIRQLINQISLTKLQTNFKINLNQAVNNLLFIVFINFKLSTLKMYLCTFICMYLQLQNKSINSFKFTSRNHLTLKNIIVFIRTEGAFFFGVDATKNRSLKSKTK